MVEVIFKGGKIQTGDRVKIPKPVMDTLELKSGKKIVIKFDPEKKRIVIEEEKKK
jgi:bifunctional DNA-binding transcriptional regulator/antitoxin component of YhaV-PrlF toxin-antitoxin module